MGLPLCLVAYFFVLGIVWAVARPYAATVDEESQYIKALGVSTGDLAGRLPEREDVPPSMLPEQRRAILAATRQFDVPHDVAPRASESGEIIFDCFVFKAIQAASCLAEPIGAVADQSYAGVYPPVPYVLPGLAARLANNPLTGLIYARLASGVVCLVILALCLWGIRDRCATGLSILGVSVALSPAVLFFAWSMNPNGLEMVAGIAFLALCLRLARPGPPKPWLWGVAALTGFVLGTSRPLAFVWIFFAVFVTALIHGPSNLRRRVGEVRRPAALLLTALAAAVITTIGWNILLQAQAPCGPTSWSDSTRLALHDVVRFFPEQVGIFGWGEVGMPPSVYLGWKVLLGSLASVALIVGTWRHRLATVVLAVSYLGGVILYLKVTHGCGFPMGGRYVQPAFTAFPIMWGEVILLQQRRLRAGIRRGLVVAALTFVGATNVIALAVNARRYAVGNDRPWSELWSGPAWLPPGGWLLWFVLTALGLSILLVGLLVFSTPETQLPRRGADGRDRPISPAAPSAGTSGA